MLSRLIQYLESHETILYWICVGLLLPALLINLGLGAIMMDEPTRAIVALEMMFSGNYITPTIFGEYYYNKPPFYNWILVAIFQGTGDTSEWAVRLPVVFFLLAYGLTIFYFVRAQLQNWKIAFFAAIMFVTCGRMLIMSSFVGHIDIFYSWITFMSFMAMYHYMRRENWLMLFMVSYFLAAIGFMCKGLPAIVFQGSSLLAVFVYHKQFRRLFYWQHFAGGAVFLLIVGAYFYAYSQYHSLEEYFPTLWFESSRRTPIHQSWIKSVLHLFTFPFEMLGHVAPWSILVVYCLRRDFWKRIWQIPLLSFAVLMLGANLIPYWLSPDTRPRYIFMLYPFLFLLIGYAYYYYRESSPKINKILETIFLVASILATFAVWAVPFVEVVQDLPAMWAKVIFLFLALGTASFLYARMKLHRLVLFAIILLLFRIGFDWFVQTHRYYTGTLTPYQQNGIRIGEITQGEELRLHDGFYFNHDLTYYISRERKEILRKHSEVVPDIFYICDDSLAASRPHVLYLDFHEQNVNRHLNLVKFKKETDP